MKTVGIDFDPRNYGFSKLSELIAAIGLFEIDRREKGVYVKDTRKKRPLTLREDSFKSVSEA
jgi:hypothetical protein